MSRIAKLKLEIKDYSTKDQAINEFVGEVVSIDESLKTNLYRFFETDMGTILVSIDYHNEQVVIQENSETIRLIMVLKDSCFEKCVYHFDENNYLELKTKAFEIVIDESYVRLDYDLYNPSDLDHPMTRNVIEITCEGNKVC